MTAPTAGKDTHDEPLVGADLAKLRTVKLTELLIRFAFGAAISIVAGLISLAFNHFVGGMFLAFPAILPASLTLLEKKEGNAQATSDLQGAVLGAIALGGFAVVAGFGLRRAGAPLALLAALAAWTALAVAIYLAVEFARRRR
jgi:hypothetical protein